MMKTKRLRSYLISAAALIIAFSLFISAAVFASDKTGSKPLSQNEQALADLKTRLETAESNKKALLSTLDKNKGEMHEFDERKQAIEINITYTEEEIEIINELSAKYSDIIKQAEKSIVEQEVKLELAKSDFASIVKYLYENGRTSVLELMLSSENISEFFRKYDYIDGLLEYNDHLMQEINDATENLNNIKSDYDSAMKALEQYKTELVQKQEALKAEYEELDKLMQEYSSGVDRTKEQLEAAEKAEQELLEQISAMQAKISEQEAAEASERERLASISRAEESRKQATATTKAVVTTAATTKSAGTAATQAHTQTPTTTAKNTDSKISDYYVTTFAWPLSIKGRITSRYGLRTDSPFTSSEHHNGIDIAAPKDTPILAAASGVVTRSEYAGVFGNVVVIDHGNGLSTLYCHCNSRLVTVGAKVLTDQVIAKVGQTGQASGYHLHFAVIKNGSYTDPEPYLPKGYLK